MTNLDVTSRNPLARAPRAGFVIALALSLALHAGVLVTSSSVSTSNTNERAAPVVYDATLAPLIVAEAALPVAKPVAAAPTAVPRARPARAPRVSEPTSPEATAPPTPTALEPTAPSAANFAAPEGALAVPPRPTDAEATSASDTTKTLPAETNAATEAPTKPAPSEAKLPAANTEAKTAEVSNTSETASVANASTPKPSTRVAPNFAEKISIEYRMTSSIANGIANFRWQRQGDEFKIDSTIQPSGFVVAALVGTITQQSEGRITPEGLRPRKFSIRRGEGSGETADFDREAKKLLFKGRGEPKSVALADEMQDMQSFLFQLAYDAPRVQESSEDGTLLNVSVTNARKVYQYRFRKVGTEVIQTRAGKIETIRLLSESANPKDAYEVWLAPKYFYLPVKLRYFLGDFELTQTATRISVSAQPDAKPEATNSAQEAPVTAKR